ncbi:hypothetical protein [Caballeronia sp. S22]|uniref:hypothetical protein n=1 Tax=Caballeronia sp. S22 TaxID=3137182 RepID=UPI0035313271
MRRDLIPGIIVALVLRAPVSQLSDGQVQIVKPRQNFALPVIEQSNSLGVTRVAACEKALLRL